MAYADRVFPTKKAFKEAIKNGEKVHVEPNYFGGDGGYAPGRAAISGPGGGQPNKWYADVEYDNTTKQITKVRS